MGKVKELLITAQELIVENNKLKKQVLNLKERVRELELSKDISLPY